MSRLAAALSACLMAGVTLVLAQQAPRDGAGTSASGTGSIAGVLLTNGRDAKPVRRARITLNSDTAGGWTTVSGDKGEFAFDRLPAGRFTLSATKEAYVPATYGARRPLGTGTAIPLTEGQHVTGITLQMLHGAVITGVVRDDRGRPALGVSVSVLRREIRDGARWLVAYGSAHATDETGRYRVFGLPPGDFLIQVTGAAGTAGPAVVGLRETTTAEIQRLRAAAQGGQPYTPPPPQPGVPAAPQRRGYVPVFHPNATDPANATWITLAAGEERAGVDVTLTLLPTAQIEGTITTPIGKVPPAQASLTLTSDSPQITNSGILPGTSTRPDAKGHFLFAGLAPGTYALSARVVVPVSRNGESTSAGASSGRGGGPSPETESYFASVTLPIQGVDTSIQLDLHRGADASGHFAFNGAAAVPSSFTPYRFSLRPVDPMATTSALATIQPNGEFRVRGIAPGKYQVNWLAALPGPWWPVSATIGGKDVLDTPLEVRQGDEIQDLVIAFTDTPSEFTGVLTDASGRAASEYWIVVFPKNTARWTPRSRWIAAVRPGTDGRFVTKGLPPGDYLVAALTDVEQGEWFLPEFLQSLVTAAAPVSLAAGQTTTQDFKIGGQPDADAPRVRQHR